jgi:hypothetical protein
MNETPRTDEKARQYPAGFWVDADFARVLEREGNILRSTLREYLALGSIDGRAERQPLRAKLSALANGKVCDAGGQS